MSIILNSEQELDLEKLELADVRIDKEGTYARKNQDQKNIESLEEKLKNGIELDPIKVQPVFNYPYKDEKDHNLTIDDKTYENFAVLINAGGGHRKVSYEEYKQWRKKANQEDDNDYPAMEPNFEISKSPTPIDYKKEFSNLLIRDFQDNDDQGLGNRNSDTETTARRLKKNNPDWSGKDIANKLNRTQGTISPYIDDIVANQRASAKMTARRLSRLGWTQKEIGEVINKSREWVAQNVNSIGANKINNLYEANKSLDTISNALDIDQQTIWSYLLEDKDDLEKAKELGINIHQFDIWGIGKIDEKMGKDYPGRIPGQIVVNTLAHFTEQKDLVVDPMAGGGVTNDACLMMNRKCVSYDKVPSRKDIRKWDITEGAPDLNKSVDLVFLDPPYFAKKAKEYNLPDKYLTKEGFLDFAKAWVEYSKQTLNSKGRVALLISDYKAYDDEDRESIFSDEYANLFEQEGFERLYKISIPLSTEQYRGSQVKSVKKEKGKLLMRGRELYILEV